jgi:serine/threonine protein kinase
MERPGDMIGPYRLLEPVGSGGFGVVWKAERTEPFRQTVAIKVIKAGMDTHAVLARFDAERRTLARMDHPGIARVLDGGMTGSGRPYFVMEFVEGVPITRFADSARLDLRARSALVADAADAVQHAHAKGVIHRDLKPSNILVARNDDGTPRVKVIDFGIAKSLSDDDASMTITEAGQRIGTPEYMSPEQADPEGLDVDTRSDVYGLGAILYELLVGAPPLGERLDGSGNTGANTGANTSARERDAAVRRTSGTASRAQLLRAVLEELPAKPSARALRAGETVCAARATTRAALARTLAAELEWIPLKALRKEPDARYASAAALAADLRHYLDGRALDAGPESATYRLRALARRHRGPVTLAAFGLVLLVAATAVSSYFAWSESIARAEAQASAETARIKAAEAQARAEEARRVATFQARIVDAMDPAWVGAQIMQDLVNLHAISLRAVETDADLRKERREKLWAEQGLLNRPDLGRTVIERWVLKPTSEGIEAEFGDIPVAAAAMRHALANRRHALGDPAGARADIERALSDRRRLLGDLHPDTLDSMAIAGRILWALGEAEPALQLLGECARGRAQALGKEALPTLEVAQARAVLESQSDPVTAVAELERIVEIRRRVQGAVHGETAGAERDLGIALLAAERAAEAEPLLRNALAASRVAVGPDAAASIRSSIAHARCLWTLSRVEEAAPLARDAVERASRQFGARDAFTLYARGVLASILADSRDPSLAAEALLAAQTARSTAAKVLGETNPTTLQCALAEIRAHVALGAGDDARRVLDEIAPRIVDGGLSTRLLSREIAALRARLEGAAGATAASRGTDDRNSPEATGSAGP